MFFVTIGAASGFLLTTIVVATALDPSRVAKVGAGRFQRARRRARAVVWLCLVATGMGVAISLSARGVGLSDLASPAFTTSSTGRASLLAIGLLALLAILSTWYDFALGPRAVQASALAPHARPTRSLQRAARVVTASCAALGAALVFAVWSIAL